MVNTDKILKLFVFANNHHVGHGPATVKQFTDLGEEITGLGMRTDSRCPAKTNQELDLALVVNRKISARFLLSLTQRT